MAVERSGLTAFSFASGTFSLPVFTGIKLPIRGNFARHLFAIFFSNTPSAISQKFLTTNFFNL
ncbi:MAG: hypothetical protein L6365_13630 [Desulfobulbaceae bacterium]|nr:hypothetical protein [Pseudomonadota bacterium]MCG2748560.1 hypothetical protein [Desulfobulbaceae bacterium]